MNAFIFIVILSLWVFFVSGENWRPVIGILTQPTPQHHGHNEHWDETSYLPATYVKFMQASNAQVIPIPFDGSEEEIETLFNQVNGIIFPGGSLNFTTYDPFWDVSKQIFELAKSENDNGDYFPIFGVCQGFQILHALFSDDRSILEKFHSYGYYYPLNFTQEVSAFFDTFLSNYGDLKNSFLKPITLNWHSLGVSPSRFNTYQSLKDELKIISTNYDEDGKEFISYVEGKNYPFMATQFHPENVVTDSHPQDLNKNLSAVIASQFFSYYFVTEAWKSSHRFTSDTELENLLIDNYEPMYTKGLDANYDYIYYFPLADVGGAAKITTISIFALVLIFFLLL